MKIKGLHFYLAFCAFTLPSFHAQALGNPHYVALSKRADAFTLVANHKAAPMIVDSSDWPGVVRAAGDLSKDVERVTGVRAGMANTKSTPAEAEVVIIGTIGRSKPIDDLIHAGKLNVAEVQGKWEAAVTTVVEHPSPGVARALVIAGSDKRGTIFGIYDLSEEIGVSPWYWWADVRIPHHDELFVTPGRYLQSEPAVKYRGIFLNDEAPSLSGFAKAKFGGYNSRFYANVFELLLRLKANYLWPAMWNSAFNEDDPENPRMADMYGIVMGTSHHEPMLRSQQEWKRHGSGPWNYETNSGALQDFWKAGIERNKNLESTVTIGMRGDGDKPMSDKNNVALLEQIVRDQRKIVADTGTPTLKADVKLWALYKEVQDYYDQGMRVPDDVTLLWCDDNWGNIRRLPTPEEGKRSGGAGMYYHFDYVGGPRNYKWLNTNPIPKVWEQMHLALEYGADRVWIVNVGDLKPMEFPMEFFLSYARTPSRWTQNDLHTYTVEWAKREFGSEHAEEIATDIEDYTRYNGRRKPELISPTTFSTTNFNEASRVEAEWDGLQKRVDALAEKLPEDQKASFFELVQYPVDASATVTEMYIAAGQNALAAKQGRAIANDFAARTHFLFDRDRQLSDRYNHGLLQGRWNHMMDQVHIGYTGWNDPPANVMPPVIVLKLPDAGELNVAIGGDTGASLSLGEFDSVAQQVKTFTIFNKGTRTAKYHVSTDAPWLQLPRNATTLDGEVSKQIELPIHVDWKNGPEVSGEANILVQGDKGEIAKIHVTARRLNVTRENAKGFVESEGIVAIEAADTSERMNDKDVHWEELPGFGRTRSAMTVFPVTAASNTASKASLDYRMDLYDAGDFKLRVVLAPTLNFVPGRGLRFAVSVDDATPVLVDALQHNSQKDWEKTVSDAVREVVVSLKIASPGSHTLHIFSVDAGVVIERMVLVHGTLPPSYLGPPESFHVTAPAVKQASVVVR